jgi:hypothetical protein
MQRDQKLSLGVVEVKVPEEKEESFGKAFAAKRERYGITVTKGLGERGNIGGVKGEASDMRTCYACGEKDHVRAHCRKRSAECYNCGERGTLARCVGSPEVLQEVVVKTGRSVPVWRLRRGPKRRVLDSDMVYTAKLSNSC